MQLTTIDWIVIVAYFAVSLGVGLYYSRRAGKNIAEFFVSGRSLPWWIAGTSMVATTFAADTPLAVTSLVIKYGLAGNWFWWSFAVGGMFTVFIFARLWRRAEVMTDVELVEIRYGGKPAAILRGFRAIYLAVPINAIVMGWVNFAMLKVLKVTEVSMGMPDWAIVAITLGITGFYTLLSGFWGVAITDVIQFVIAMVGCIALAVFAVDHVGGPAALEQKLTATFGGGQALSFLPQFDASIAWLSLEMFLVYIFIMWWGSWYPGAEPGGGGYVVQRMASCKDERHSVFATLWFQIAHYCIRPWPWLLVGLVALVMHPELKAAKDPGEGFPMLMRELLPAGWRGLLLVAFFAAYMSTLSTQINWGASYLINDVYRRFMAPEKSDRHYTWASRLVSLMIMILGGLATMFISSVDEAWKFIAAISAGTGAVFILRWFWWRINAWSEIIAMIASLTYFLVIRIVAAGQPTPTDPHWLQVLRVTEYQTAVITVLTSATWLLATFLTPSESRETLLAFFRKVRPGGPGWAPMERLDPTVERDRNLGTSIAAAILGMVVIYTILPGTGFMIFGHWIKAIACLGTAAVAIALMIYMLNRAGWAKVTR